MCAKLDGDSAMAMISNREVVVVVNVMMRKMMRMMRMRMMNLMMRKMNLMMIH
jgi:hypothetical protein